MSNTTNKSLQDKYEALKKIDRCIPKKDVAVEFKVPRNTLPAWVKNKEKIVKAFESGNRPTTQKLKASGYENLDKAVYKWFVSPDKLSSTKGKGCKICCEARHRRFKSIKWLV